jgi:hypothetical protein
MGDFIPKGHEMNLGKTHSYESKEKISISIGTSIFVYSLKNSLLLTFPSSSVWSEDPDGSSKKNR